MICPECNKEKPDVREVMSPASMILDGKTNVLKKMCGDCEVKERKFAEDLKKKYGSYRSDNKKLMLLSTM